MNVRWLAILLTLSTSLCASALNTYTGNAASSPRLRGTDVFPAGAKPAPNFSLSDQVGKRISVRSLRGTVTAITFLDSTCAQECPVVGREVATAQRLLARNTSLQVVVVSVSSRDTPPEARLFMKDAGVRAPWHWLFGRTAQLLPVWNEYGIWVHPTKTDVLHTAALYLLDRHGSVRVADAIPVRPSQLAESIMALQHP